MTDPELEPLRYPVGRFRPEPQLDGARRAFFIEQIAALPATLRTAVQDLTDAQLDTPYRPGGWTIRQVVHHVPDSHLNSYLRVKLALTEDNPTIKPYQEAEWAKLPDSRLPVEVSLRLLEAVHERWVVLLRSLVPDQWARTFLHPERGPMSLDVNLQLYAWHGRHHLAHVTNTLARPPLAAR